MVPGMCVTGGVCVAGGVYVVHVVSVVVVGPDLQPSSARSRRDQELMILECN
jgi:hypothetical protein